MFNNLKILFHQGKQFIRDVRNVKVPGIFRGRPVISLEKVDETALVNCCPTQAISTAPVAIDLGKCTFCGECAMLFPGKIVYHGL
jgi:Fe-S-cluster-containing hydrogenase component 2